MPENDKDIRFVFEGIQFVAHRCQNTFNLRFTEKIGCRKMRKILSQKANDSYSNTFHQENAVGRIRQDFLFAIGNIGAKDGEIRNHTKV